MKTYTLIGVVLIIVGIAALAYQGITYTTREKVVDLGPIAPGALNKCAQNRGAKIDRRQGMKTAGWSA
jgi:uncharacterized membrane protein YidH (DUF202 family)